MFYKKEENEQEKVESRNGKDHINSLVIGLEHCTTKTIKELTAKDAQKKHFSPNRDKPHNNDAISPYFNFIDNAE